MSTACQQIAEAKQAFAAACAKAKARSAEPDYRGCSVHLNVSVALRDGYPQIFGYGISDWYSSESTVATFVNGEMK